MAESKKKVTVVTAPLIAVKTDDGRRVYLMRGAEVGDGFDKDDVSRLRDMELVGDLTEFTVPGVGVLAD